MNNFGKPIQEFTDHELLNSINNWDPRYGMIAYSELLRRDSIRNSQSSKKYGWWSLAVSIVAIAVTVVIGIFQINLGKTQVAPLLDEQARNDRRAYDICKEPGNAKLMIDWGINGMLSCTETYERLKSKFES